MVGFFKNSVGLAFTALVAITAGATPPAEAMVVSESVKVRFRDLDLSKPRDVDRLVARIGVTASEVCGASPFSLLEIKIEVSKSECWRDSVANAIRRIGDPRLTAALRRHPAFASGGSEITGSPSHDLQ